LPILDYDDIIYGNCTTTDSNLLESVLTAAAQLILGCLRTTSRKIILEQGFPTFLLRRTHLAF